MIYRTLKGGERVSALGLGTAYLGDSSPEEIEEAFSFAIDKGINLIDLAAGSYRVFKPLGRAMEGRREKVKFQLHLGAYYSESGEYGWTRDLGKIKEMLEREFKDLGTDCADFLFLHCIDDEEDLDAVLKEGIYDLAKKLKAEGRARHLGFSSHTPKIARRLLDIGGFDAFMFSVNAAYDEEAGDEFAIGNRSERLALYERAKEEGVAITVMKPFLGGKLLDARQSPFREAMTKGMCVRYALDRPGVAAVLPGVRNKAEVQELLHILREPPEQTDYSKVIRPFAGKATGKCVYCDHCLPCPAGIDIGLVNKYYDLALLGDPLAKGHYEKLTEKAGDCLRCGHCDRRCPFDVKQSERMGEIATYFGF